RRSPRSAATTAGARARPPSSLPLERVGRLEDLDADRDRFLCESLGVGGAPDHEPVVHGHGDPRPDRLRQPRRLRGLHGVVPSDGQEGDIGPDGGELGDVVRVTRVVVRVRPQLQDVANPVVRRGMEVAALLAARAIPGSRVHQPTRAVLSPHTELLLDASAPEGPRVTRSLLIGSPPAMDHLETAGPGPRRPASQRRAVISLLRRNRDFRMLFLAQVVSFTGDWFLFVALAGLVFDLTHSPGLVAAVYASLTVPFAFFMFVGGPLADRLNRQALMIVADVIRGFLALGFFLVHRTSEVWLVYVLAGAITALGAVFEPASMAAIPNLVDREDLATARVKGGFGLGGGVVALLPVLAFTVYGTKDWGTGVLYGFRGLGVLAGPFLARRFIGDEDLVGLFWGISLSFLIYGASYAVVPWMPTIYLAGLMVLIGHLGGGAQWTLSSYALQILVPDHIRGRIFAFDEGFITLTLATSATLAGWISDVVDVRVVMLGLAAITLSYSVIWTIATRNVRRSLGSEARPGP